MLNKCLLPALVLACILTGCTPTKEDYKKDFIKGCVNRYAKDTTVASTEGRILVEEYCKCLGENLDAKMNVEQWRSFNKSGDTLMTKYQQEIQPCMEDFKQKLSVLHP